MVESDFLKVLFFLCSIGAGTLQINAQSATLYQKRGKERLAQECHSIGWWQGPTKYSLNLSICTEFTPKVASSHRPQAQVLAEILDAHP